MGRICDGDWELFDHDFRLKRTVWMRRNADGTTTMRTDYAVDDTLEANRDMRNVASAGWKGDWHKVASIPLNVFHDQLAEASRQDDSKFIDRWLNDANNRAYRTKDGKL